MKLAFQVGCGDTIQMVKSKIQDKCLGVRPAAASENTPGPVHSSPLLFVFETCVGSSGG